MNIIEQLLLFKRLLIIFGSVCLLWSIVGFIFLFIQTYRRLKRQTKEKLFRYNRSLILPSSLLTSIGISLKEDNISHNERNDTDHTGVCPSVLFISKRSKIIYEHTDFIPSYQRIPEEKLDVIFSNLVDIAKVMCQIMKLTAQKI